MLAGRYAVKEENDGAALIKITLNSEGYIFLIHLL